MVDFTSQARNHGYLVSANQPLQPVVPSYRDLYRRINRQYLTAENEPHDCRSQRVKEYTEEEIWAAWMLTSGLRNTAEATQQLQEKDGPPPPDQHKHEKLLYEGGSRGKSRGQFLYPRNLAVDTAGDIVVTDGHNARVQRYTQTCIYSSEFGIEGGGRGELSRPWGVAVTRNNDVVIADSGNRRLQIFRPNGRLRHVISTGSAQPQYVQVLDDKHVVCSTSQGMLQIYDMSSQTLLSEISLGDSHGLPSHCMLAATPSGELAVCDGTRVTVYEDSQLLMSWEVPGIADGLGVKVSCICSTGHGTLLVGDSLNHTVAEYNLYGQHLDTVLAPTDQLGCPRACVVSPEGHLVILESSLNGPHGLKVFRYRDCECHRAKSGTSKRATPVSTGRRSAVI